MRRLVRYLLSTLGLLLLWTVVAGAGLLEGWGRSALAPRGDTAAFMAELSQQLEAESAGNVVCALIEGGSVYGEYMSSVGEPVGRDTAFQVASLGKWVTAWGVMTLVEQGRLDLDAPVSGYLTRWELPPSEFDNDGVTVRRLLSHTAGLTDGLGYAGFEPGQSIQTLEASLSQPHASSGEDIVVRVGLEPGTDFKYSGGGYTLLQLLIEEVSGETFEAYMQHAVFEPLGMGHSTFSWRDRSDATLAEFYDVDSTPATHYRFTAQAAAGLYTTVADLTRLIQAHLPGPGGAPVGRGVLRSETLEAMREPHASQLAADIWGLGTILYAGNGAGGYVVGHDGNNDPAINTAARFNPATGNGIVILETGNRLLATRLAGEWVFWETGNLDTLTLIMESGGMLRVIAVGWGVIVLGVILVAWQRSGGRRARESA